VRRFSKQPTALRQVTGFALTGVVISLAVGFGFVLFANLMGRPLDGWAPAVSFLGSLLVSFLALPFVFAGQTLLGIPALIAARRLNLMIHPAFAGGIGALTGALACGCLVIPLMHRDLADVATFLMLAAISGFIGGNVWWFTVERLYVWSWNV
jgi:hypothetical protein